MKNHRQHSIEISRQMLILALDSAATESEAEIAVIKLVRRLRTDGIRGYDIIGGEGPTQISRISPADFRMPIGRHKGRTFGEINELDAQYLWWGVDGLRDRYPAVARQIASFLKVPF